MIFLGENIFSGDSKYKVVKETPYSQALIIFSPFTSDHRPI